MWFMPKNCIGLTPGVNSEKTFGVKIEGGSDIVKEFWKVHQALSNASIG